MKIYISADMEGVAGVVDWDQCRAGAPGHEQGARLLLGEVNAAIEGAVAGGADEVTVNDSHGLMANLAPDLLAGRAGYLSGRHKPDYMMQGLDASYDAVLFVGYHGSMPSGRCSRTPTTRARCPMRASAASAQRSRASTRWPQRVTACRWCSSRATSSSAPRRSRSARASGPSSSSTQ